jgi:hypothetical protein
MPTPAPFDAQNYISVAFCSSIRCKKLPTYGRCTRTQPCTRWMNHIRRKHLQPRHVSCTGAVVPRGSYVSSLTRVAVVSRRCTTLALGDSIAYNIYLLPERAGSLITVYDRLGTRGHVSNGRIGRELIAPQFTPMKSLPTGTSHLPIFLSFFLFFLRCQDQDQALNAFLISSAPTADARSRTLDDCVHYSTLRKLCCPGSCMKAS